MNNRVEIVLLSPQQGTLDIDKNTEVPFTFSIADIRDISQKKGSFSKTIKLAGTKNNNILLNNYFDVNIEAGTFDVNKLQKVQVLQNGVPILENGYLQLLSINKVQNIINVDAFVEYDVLIKDDISDLFTKINNLTLKDIEFGDYDHNFTADHVVSTLNNTYLDGYKYFFPYKDSNEYSLPELKPAIFAKVYWDRILGGAGFTYEWDTLSASTVQFDKLIIPYNGDQLKLNPDDITDIQVIAQNSGSTFLEYTAATTPVVITYNEEVQDNSNVFNPSIGAYTNTYYIFNTNTLVFNYELEFEVILRNFGTTDAYLTNTFQSNIEAIRNHVPFFTLRKNGSTVITQEISLAQDEFQSVEGDVIPTGDTSFGIITRSLNVGTNLGVPFDIFDTRAGINSFQLGIGSTWRDTNSVTGNTVNVKTVFRLREIRVSIAPNSQFIGFNMPMRLNDIVPNSIKQSDYLKSIMTMYNLFVETDDLQPNHLIFKHRDEFYDEGAIVDWTQKLGKDRDQTITLLPNLSSKKIILTYKHDDKDELMKGYLDSVKEIYGQVEITFDSEYVKNTDKKELIFSPVVIGKNINNNVLPYIDGMAPKNNIKIALNAQQKTVEQPITIFNFVATGLTGTSVTATTIPLVSHFDKETNPTFDINFGVNDYYYYQNIGNPTNNNLYNLHWRRTMSQINNGKMLTAYFKLDENDINQLDLNQKVFINNTYWNINQIIDYKAGKRDLTKVELISIDDELLLAPFQTNSLLANNGGNSISQSIKAFVKNYKNNTNVIFSNQIESIDGYNNFVSDNVRSSQIYGDNNILSSSNSFVLGSNNNVNSTSFINGSNNIVEGGLENVSIFGSGISATTANTLYTNNIVISSGSTINGIPMSAVTNPVFVLGTGTESIKANNSTTIVSSGQYSYAEGNMTTASGFTAHAEGQESVAGGAFTHAEGWVTTALGTASHSEGFATKALGNTSHAEGNSTIATGNTSHAEGAFTRAIGDFTHSKGSETFVYDDYSEAGGKLTISNFYNEYARGHNINIIPPDKYAMSQYGTFTLSNYTVGNTPEILSPKGTTVYPLVIEVDSTYAFTCTTVIRDDSTGESKLVKFDLLIKDVGGTVSIVGTPTYTTVFQDAALAGTSISTAIVSNEIEISVTGVIGANLHWSTRVDYTVMKNRLIVI